MYAPAAALAWEFWGRHRWGLAAVAATVLLFAGLCADGSFTPNEAAVSSIWFVMGLAYVIGVFAYGFEGKLETAESGFPARLFVLPVRTAVLVGWPMVQGIATAVLLWLAWDRFVLRPSGVETPGWWPAMLAAVVATSQALVWLPFGLPWVRLVVAVPVLAVLVKAEDIAALMGYLPANPDRVFGWLGVVLIPTAFLTAWGGVSLARRGDAPDWLYLLRPLTRLRSVWRERPPFASPTRALVWYEWRLRGIGYLISVLACIALFLGLALLLEMPEQRPGFVATVVGMPFLLAAVWGSYMGAAGDSVRSPFALTAFGATRPVSSAGIVAAKLRAAAEMAAVMWGLALVIAVAWLAGTGGFHLVTEEWDRKVARVGTERAAVSAGLLLVGAVPLIWRMLVANLWVGLTGRAWVSHLHMIVVTAVGVEALYYWNMWAIDTEKTTRVRDVLLGLAIGAVALKLLVAGWAFHELQRRGEANARTLGWIAAGWAVIAAALFVLLLWVLPADQVVVHWLALLVVLLLPLARPAVAPLALAWNRHR